MTGFDRNKYMKRYMRELREAQKPKPLPSTAERKKQWECRAGEMRAMAATMGGVPRMMMEKLAADYEWLARRIDNDEPGAP